MTDEVNDAINGVETPVQEQQEETAQDQPAEAEKPEAEPVETIAPEKTDEQTVPLAALLAERDAKQTLNARIAALEGMMKAPKEPEPLPDVLDDQAGFVTQMETRMNAAVANATANMSQSFAEQQFGKEAVASALQAAQLDPQALASIKASPMPYQALMEWDQRQKTLAEIGDPVEYKKQVEADIRKRIEAELVVKQAQEAAGTKTPSLATEPNMGNRAPAFEAPDLNALIGPGG